MVSPRDSASTPKAAAPRAEIPPHTSSTPIRFMGPKARRNLGPMNRIGVLLVWGGISALGAAAFGVLALSRGETINAAWLLTAAVCTRSEERHVGKDGRAR